MHLMKSNREWLEWGRRDPLQGVATWPGHERGAAAAWTDEAFYALGTSEWNDFAKAWLVYGIDSSHCLEFGCGAGRMTRSLAPAFARVTAVDISREQIAYAQAHLSAAEVTFAAIDGVHVPLPDASATAFFSTYVFQHFATLTDAAAVIREMARVLAPGATVFLQLPLFRLPETRATALLRRVHRFERRLAGWKNDLQRRRGKLVMRMLWFERDWLAQELQRAGFGDLLFRDLVMSANGQRNDLVLARRT